VSPGLDLFYYFNPACVQTPDQAWVRFIALTLFGPGGRDSPGVDAVRFVYSLCRTQAADSSTRESCIILCIR
jgi:hypothetical protein